jgi:hypothetical protein
MALFLKAEKSFLLRFSCLLFFPDMKFTQTLRVLDPVKGHSHGERHTLFFDSNLLLLFALGFSKLLS